MWNDVSTVEEIRCAVVGAPTASFFGISPWCRVGDRRFGNISTSSGFQLDPCSILPLDKSNGRTKEQEPKYVYLILWSFTLSWVATGG